MTTSTPQQQAQKLQQCVQECRTIIGELQTLTQNSGNNLQLQSSLKEAIHHTEMCMQECTYAMKATT